MKRAMKLAIPMLASVLSFTVNAFAFEAPGTCIESRVSRFKFEAILDSNEFEPFYDDDVHSISSFIRRIEEIPGKPSTYRVDTALRDGSKPLSFEVAVFEGKNCEVTNSDIRVTSVKLLPVEPLPQVQPSKTYAMSRSRGGHSDGGGSPCPPSSYSQGEIRAILQSEALKRAYAGPGMYLHSVLRGIQWIGGNVYLVKSSYQDGSEPRTFETHVMDGSTCFVDWPFVDSVVQIP